MVPEYLLQGQNKSEGYMCIITVCGNCIFFGFVFWGLVAHFRCSEHIMNSSYLLFLLPAVSHVDIFFYYDTSSFLSEFKDAYLATVWFIHTT